MSNDYKNKDILAIDLGSYSLMVAVGKAAANGLNVKKAFSVPISSGLYGNGDIQNYQELRSVISEFVVENGFKGFPVAFTFSSMNSFIRVLEVPSVKDTELRELIDYEMQQFLPSDIGTFITQYKYLTNPNEKDAKTVRVMVGTIPRPFGEALWKLALDCDLQPAFLDVHTNAVSKVLNAARGLNGNHDMAKQNIAMIEIGHLITEISLYEQGEFQFNRRIQTGGHQLDQRISMVFDVSADEARVEKHRPIDINKEVFEYTEENRVFNTLKTGVDEWVVEIEKVVKFYYSRKPGTRIDHCYLYGGGAGVMGIDGYIAAALGISVEMVSQLDTGNAITCIDNKQLHLYMNALGALYRMEDSKR